MEQMKVVLDIETDGFNPSKIHCIVAIDEHDNIYKFKPDEINKGVKFLSEADTLIGHNIVGFDNPVIEKLTDTKLSPNKIIDTLLLSRLLKPNREGGHSLETWGYRIGFHKSQQPDLLNYSDEMMNYCIKEVQLNKMLFFVFLQFEISHFLSMFYLSQLNQLLHLRATKLWQTKSQNY